MASPASILGSMKPDGSRVVMHPAEVKGKWATRRRMVFAALIAFYVAGPFIPVGGHPMIQLDVEHRRFFLFGSTFNAQDFWLVLLLVVTFAFSLLLVTAWRGRVWCGWACPQTVFLEGVYRPVERFFDGSREQRLRLDAAPWTPGKVARRAGKYATFLVISAVIAHAATALFVSPKELWLMLNEGPLAHLEAFLLTLGFTGVLMFNFTWFREQFCVVLCPYGRLQSVLHDRDSVTVAYREARGEPRGKVGTAGAGACIDCKRCVVVCPTGIDIRHGLQMECLACTACVDACDEVMDKLKRPRGLIDFASQHELAGKPTRWFRGRVALYLAVLLVAVGTLTVALVTRTPFEANVFRARGAMPFVIDGNVVRNAFEVHVFNKGADAGRFRIEVQGPAGAEVVIGTPLVELASLSDATVPVSVSISREVLSVGGAELQLRVVDEVSGAVRTQAVRFLGR